MEQTRRRTGGFVSVLWVWGVLCVCGGVGVGGGMCLERRGREKRLTQVQPTIDFLALKFLPTSPWIFFLGWCGCTHLVFYKRMRST